MTISLQKGQRISLSKEAPGLTKLMCGLGWDVVKKSGDRFFGSLSSGQNFDLDASVFCLDANQKLADMRDVVYFGNLNHESKAIIHQGDRLTGRGQGDDEVILVDLLKIPPRISRLVFVVNIYQCMQRQQDFSQVKNAFVRLVNYSNDRELARYNLSGKDYTAMTGMTLAEVYRYKNEWKLAAIGNGLKIKGLEDIARSYG